MAPVGTAAPVRLGAYPALEQRFRRLGVFGSVQSLLEWDTATMMPQGCGDARAEQQAAIAALVHRELCDSALAPLLDTAAGETLAPEQAANLRVMRHRWLHAAAVPERLVEELHRATALCEVAWREARPANDFAGLRPKLETVVRLVRERAAAKASAMGHSPYAALLDEYNPGLGLAAVDRVFDALEGFLPTLLRDVMAQQSKLPAPLPLPSASPEAQHRLGVRLATSFGFDFGHGRLDESRHPFMIGNPDDVRITTRTVAGNFVSGLLAVAHETGHALYDAGLPRAWRWQPAGDALGSAMHEGQALLWEMQVARGRAFLGFFAPMVRETLGASGPAVEADNLVRTVQRVRPGMIRVDADEVTYPLHVLLRYRVERALFDGRLEVADLPDAWNDAMDKLLGLRPRNHGEGCLQDIHWMLGNFGYFPSYALGVTAAAQLFQTAEASTPHLDASLGTGETGPLLAWLRTHIHAKGSLVGTEELLTQATGRGFDPAALALHLRRRYLEELT